MKGPPALCRTLRRLVIALAALCYALSAARAQDNLNDFVVTVRVMDAENKTPIANAQIVIRDADVGVAVRRQTGSTDANGWATLTLNEYGNFTLEASASGYKPDRASFRRWGQGEGNQYRKLFELENATAEIDRPVRLIVRVKNRLDNQPVREARVMIDPLEGGAMDYYGSTDSNGVAGFEIGVSGRYRVTVTQSSFLDKGNVRYTTIRKYADEKEVAVEVVLYGKEDSQFASETPSDPVVDAAAGAVALTVHVVEEGTGKGLPGAIVSVKLKDGRTFSEMGTDANGDAAFTEKFSVAFSYAKPGLTIEVEKKDYEKSTTEIAGNDIAAKLWHTHTVSLRMNEEGLRQRTEAEMRRAREEAEKEAEAAKQKALAAEAQRKKEASDTLERLSREIGEWASGVNGLSSARSDVLAISDRLKGLLEKAQAALNSFQGDPALARFRAACGEAMAIRSATVEEAGRAAEIEREAVSGLEVAEEAARQCRGASDVATIRENYTKAIRALGTVGAMEKAQRQANYVEMRAKLEAVRAEIEAARQLALQAAEDGRDSAGPAFSDGNNAIRALGARLLNPVEPITMGTAYQGMLSTLARDYDGALTREQRGEIQRLSNYILQVNPHPLSYYDVRSEGTPMDQTFNRLENTYYELRRVAFEVACNVQPAEEEVARIADAVVSLTIEVADDAGLANRCETRLATQAACDAVRLAWQEASAAGRVEEANTVLGQMKAAGCNVSGMAIMAGPSSALPPGLAGTSPASGNGPQPAGASSAGGTATTTLPPSLTGGAPPDEGGTGSSNAAGGSAPGSGATATLPPSLAGSAPVAQSSVVAAVAGPANSLPPSVAGSSAPQPAGGSGTATPGVNPGAGSPIQPPAPAENLPASIGSTRAGAATSPTPPPSPPVTPPAKPPSPSESAFVPGQPNGCAPPGKSWPKYVLFAVGEEAAYSVTLKEPHPSYALYSGTGPSRERIELQLNISGTSVHMEYLNGAGERVSYIGGCKEGRVEGMYQIKGRPGFFEFQASLNEWP